MQFGCEASQQPRRPRKSRVHVYLLMPANSPCFLQKMRTNSVDHPEEKLVRFAA